MHSNPLKLVTLVIFAVALRAEITISSPDSLRLQKIAPNDIAVFRVSGLSVRLKSPMKGEFPLPRTLANISAVLTTSKQVTWQLPLFGLEQFNTCAGSDSDGCWVTNLVVQIPPWGDIDAGEASVVVKEGPVTSAPFRVRLVTDNLHILKQCDFVFIGGNYSEENCAPIVTHANGTLVSSSSPAGVGEIVSFYATGLGPVNLGLETGVPTPPFPPRTVGNSSYTVGFTYTYGINQGPSKVENPQKAYRFDPTKFIGLVPGYVGLYQINMEIPAGPAQLRPCLVNSFSESYSNFTISFRRFDSYDGAAICVG